MKSIMSELLMEIDNFKKLEYNWDGYGAIPVEKDSINNTINILEKIGDDNISKVNGIYPNTHGTISIEFENNQSEKLNLEIGNTYFAYYLELNGLDVKFYNNLIFSHENIENLIKNINLLNSKLITFF
jgi:hypothetical protein